MQLGTGFYCGMTSSKTKHTYTMFGSLSSIRGNHLSHTFDDICSIYFSAFFGFVGMICWLAYVPDPYVVSYSFGLTVLASLLAAIAGCLMIPEVLDGGRQINPNRFWWRHTCHDVKMVEDKNAWYHGVVVLCKHSSNNKQNH